MFYVDEASDSGIEIMHPKEMRSVSSYQHFFKTIVISLSEERKKRKKFFWLG